MLASADGDSLVYGVVDGAFVVANDRARASSWPGEETKAVEGAKGSLVMNADAEQLVTRRCAARRGRHAPAALGAGSLGRARRSRASLGA